MTILRQMPFLRPFGLPCEHNAKAMKLLADSYAKRDLEFTETRQRMARMPKGAELIENRVSVAPGFKIGNVHVMAGVPSVFEAMLDEAVAHIANGHHIEICFDPLPIR